MTGFSGRRAAEIAGITYRQLDYWARTDLIRPTLVDATGSGSRRLYSFEDLVLLAVVRRMLDAGVRLDYVRPVIGDLRAAALATGDTYLVVVDSGAYFAATDAELMSLLRSTPSGVTNVVHLGNVHAEVASAVTAVLVRVAS